MLKDVSVVVRTLGGHLQQQVGGIAEVVALTAGCVHGLQHGHSAVKRAHRQASLTAPEVLHCESEQQLGIGLLTQ